MFGCPHWQRNNNFLQIVRIKVFPSSIKLKFSRFLQSNLIFHWKYRNLLVFSELHLGFALSSVSVYGLFSSPVICVCWSWGERVRVCGFQNSEVIGEKNDNQVRDFILSSSNYTENGSDVNSQFLLDWAEKLWPLRLKILK